MDILSIRKKKAQRSSSEVPATPSSTPTTVPTPSTMPATATAPAPTRAPKPEHPSSALVAEAPVRAQSARQAVPVAGEGALRVPAPAGHEVTGQRGRQVPDTAPDPLTGFLARYDDDNDADDDFGGIHVETVDGGDRYLSFLLGGESYAASIMDVREILTIRSLTDVPRAPKEVLGVVSKRGLVLPVIDLATALGLRTPDRRLRTSQRVLVVGDGDRICGLRVDAVSEVIKLSTQNIESVPPSVGIKNAGLLLGLGRIERHLYILLDLGAVLDSFAMSVGLSPLRQQGGR